MATSNHAYRSLVGLLTALVHPLRRVAHHARVDGRRFVWLAVLALSCTGSPGDEPEPVPRVGKITQAVDSDSDGMDDAFETQFFGSLSQTAAGDFDSDGLSNLEEYTHSLDPTVNDAMTDHDGDRYPTIFEIKNGSDPNSASSTPTPGYTVNGGGGGTHTNVNAALTAANSASNAYPIIGIAAGVYSGTGNVNVNTPSSSKKFLVIGLGGTVSTIVDAGGNNWGWNIYGNMVVASLTFRNTWLALYVSASTAEVCSGPSTFTARNPARMRGVDEPHERTVECRGRDEDAARRPHAIVGRALLEPRTHECRHRAVAEVGSDDVKRRGGARRSEDGSA